MRDIRLLTAQVATVNLVDMITNESKKRSSNNNSSIVRGSSNGKLLIWMIKTVALGHYPVER